MTTAVLGECVAEYNRMRKRSGFIKNWIAVECDHNDADMCLSEKHIHFVYEAFCESLRAEHMERLWHILRKRMKDGSSTYFKQKDRKIRSVQNYVETNAYYGLLSYICAGL